MIKKLFLLMLQIIFLINLIYSTTSIIQINFENSEFVQFYSNETLNFSSIKFFDESGFENSNDLQLIQNKNTTNFLIIGNNFLENNNVSNLNCSIFKTGKSELGFRGLKNHGENFTIYFNSSKNISWIKTEDIFLLENQTLQINQTSNIFEIKNISLCNFHIKNISTNLINSTFENSSKSKINFSFQIIPKKEIFENEKIQFQFKTNLTNFSIEYFITDYFGNILKSKKNTTNTNLKSYTPKKETQALKIKSNIYQNGIFLKSIEKLIFYIYFEKIQNSSEVCEFEIIPKYSYFENKIEFKFDTNQNNYTISYFILDENNLEVKSLKNTTNLNYKTYSPKTDISQKYFIIANLTSISCNSSKIKEILYFIKHNEKSSQIDSNTQNNINSLKDLMKINSTIEILNIADIKSQQTKEIIFRLFRGDDTKRTYYLYLNKKKLSSYELNKFSSSKIREKLNLIEGLNNITIYGINQKQELLININLSKIKTSKSSLFKKGFFQIKNFTKENSIINFTISTNLILKNISCYVNYKKTIISSLFAQRTQKDLSKITLQINNSYLLKKILSNTYDLTLICKYKKENNKNFNYESLNFQYNVSNKINPVMLELSNILTDIKSFTNQTFKTDKIYLNSSTNKAEKTITRLNFTSNSEIQKENSIFFMLISVSLITIILIFFW